MKRPHLFGPSKEEYEGSQGGENPKGEEEHTSYDSEEENLGKNMVNNKLAWVAQGDLNLQGALHDLS